MDKARISSFFRHLKAANPHPTTELDYRSPFELLVAVILSAQATDVSVNKATQTLYQVANTPRGMLALGLEGLKQHIRTIGLYNSKARHILETCRILETEHGGEVPRDREALEKLPGVGRKTANVILNTAFGEPTIAVDTHIFRVSNRTGLAAGATPLAVEKRLLEVVPRAYRKDAHHWLILHGRYTCTARAPKCRNCPVFTACEWEEKARYASLQAPAGGTAEGAARRPRTGTRGSRTRGS